MISSTRDSSPTPNQTMKSVISAIAGMNRKKWRKGSTKLLMVRDDPTNKPTGIAARLPISHPVKTRARLEATAGRSVPRVTNSITAPPMVSGEGRKNGSMKLEAAPLPEHDEGDHSDARDQPIAPRAHAVVTSSSIFCSTCL